MRGGHRTGPARCGPDHARRQARRLGQRRATGSVSPASGTFEREDRSAVRTTLLVVTDRDARGLVAQNQTREGTEAAARGIICGQAAQEIDQQVLAQILAVAGRQAQTPPQPARGRIGLADDGFNVVGGKFDLHRGGPRSSFLMSPRCRMRWQRRWERGGE